MTDIIFYAQFIASQVGKTGLTVTVDVDQITRSNLTRTSLVTGGSATEGRNGWYGYLIANVNLVLYDYIATFKTTDVTVDQREIQALWTNFPIAYDTQMETTIPSISNRLPSALVSGRMDSSVGAMASNVLTAAALADDAVTKIDAELTANHGTGSWGSMAGSGSVAYVYMVKSSIDSLPISGVDVWATTDVAGNNIVAQGVTDMNGEVTLYLDPGNYYVWRNKPGYSIPSGDPNPDDITVT